ncbi:CASP-like protein 1D1 [Oryza brachyantha]|uniref:CASP-like protein n=1 Tax=Oryza brachyantha TaxID=4533 RepID=J3MKF1_ORYBR|nr:CASP-like protein 1D1 [Oryza brachyantha]
MATVDGTTASTGAKTATVASESGGGRYGPPAAPASNSGAQVALRALLFAVSLSALVVLVTAKQTVMVPVVVRPPQFILAPVPAKFTHSPALIYLLAALCATSLYSLVTAISSLRLLSSSACSARTLFLLILLDVFYAGVMASATGSAGAVAWVGLKGNSHTRWNKICNVYGNFCRHIGSSTFLALLASALLLLLAFLNAYSLYRRTPR